VKTRIAILVALAAAPAGCGAPRHGAGPEWESVFVETPWDKPLVPAEPPRLPAGWISGEVIEVSPDGHRFSVKIDAGRARVGERLRVYLPLDPDPIKRFVPGDMRGMQVCRARVTAFEGETIAAEVAEGTRVAPVQPGDRVVCVHAIEPPDGRPGPGP